MLLIYWGDVNKSFLIDKQRKTSFSYLYSLAWQDGTVSFCLLHFSSRKSVGSPPSPTLNEAPDPANNSRYFTIFCSMGLHIISV